MLEVKETFDSKNGKQNIQNIVSSCFCHVKNFFVPLANRCS